MIGTAGLDPRAALALLEWQIELGATEAIGDVPLPRWETAEAAVAAPPAVQPAPARVPEGAVALGEAVAAAEAAAGAAASLEALEAAMAAYPFCELRRGAKTTVFADGRPGARVMIVGEGPGREEDLAGRPFVGAAGRMLDRMFGAIGLSRQAPDLEAALYITNVVPWRPPSNRDPEEGEVAMMLPFLRRHIALADPEVLVCLGNVSCHALLGRRGVLRMRGVWAEAEGRPVLPMCHPAYLLRTPEAKRDAWSDLLALAERLGR